jgi:hypothetical protein
VSTEFNKSLAPSTAGVLYSLSEIEALENFTLVGGSALSIFLKHRISEDLDFLTWFGKLEAGNIDQILNKASQMQVVKIINTYPGGLDVLINNVKVTFFANNWDKLKEREKLLQNSYLGSIELLTAMKTNTLSLRAKLRDYYDLYMIARKVFDIRKILEISLRYIPVMTKKIFAMQLVYTEDIDDENIEHLKPEYDISIDDIRIYFEREIKKIL